MEKRDMPNAVEEVNFTSNMHRPTVSPTKTEHLCSSSIQCNESPVHNGAGVGVNSLEVEPEVAHHLNGGTPLTTCGQGFTNVGLTTTCGQSGSPAAVATDSVVIDDASINSQKPVLDNKRQETSSPLDVNVSESVNSNATTDAADQRTLVVLDVEVGEGAESSIDQGEGLIIPDLHTDNSYMSSNITASGGRVDIDSGKSDTEEGGGSVPQILESPRCGAADSTAGQKCLITDGDELKVDVTNGRCLLTSDREITEPDTESSTQLTDNVLILSLPTNGANGVLENAESQRIVGDIDTPGLSPHHQKAVVPGCDHSDSRSPSRHEGAVCSETLQSENINILAQASVISSEPTLTSDPSAVSVEELTEDGNGSQRSRHVEVEPGTGLSQRSSGVRTRSLSLTVDTELLSRRVRNGSAPEYQVDRCSPSSAVGSASETTEHGQSAAVPAARGAKPLKSFKFRSKCSVESKDDQSAIEKKSDVSVDHLSKSYVEMSPNMFLKERRASRDISNCESDAPQDGSLNTDGSPCPSLPADATDRRSSRSRSVRSVSAGPAAAAVKSKLTSVLSVSVPKLDRAVANESGRSQSVSPCPVKKLVKGSSDKSSSAKTTGGRYPGILRRQSSNTLAALSSWIVGKKGLAATSLRFGIKEKFLLDIRSKASREELNKFIWQCSKKKSTSPTISSKIFGIKKKKSPTFEEALSLPEKVTRKLDSACLDSKKPSTGCVLPEATIRGVVNEIRSGISLEVLHARLSISNSILTRISDLVKAGKSTRWIYETLVIGEMFGYEGKLAKAIFCVILNKKGVPKVVSTFGVPFDELQGAVDRIRKRIAKFGDRSPRSTSLKENAPANGEIDEENHVTVERAESVGEKRNDDSLKTSEKSQDLSSRGGVMQLRVSDSKQLESANGSTGEKRDTAAQKIARISLRRVTRSSNGGATLTLPKSPIDSPRVSLSDTADASDSLTADAGESLIGAATNTADTGESLTDMATNAFVDGQSLIDALNTADAGEPSTGSVTNTADAGELFTDTATNTVDDGEPLTDADTNTADAGESLVGAATNTADAGEPLTDADTNTADAGEPLTDADTNTADAGEPLTDADTNTADAGESLTDADTNTADAGESLIGAATNTADAGELLTDADTNIAGTGESLIGAATNIAGAGDSSTDAATKGSSESAGSGSCDCADVSGAGDIPILGVISDGKSDVPTHDNVAVYKTSSRRSLRRRTSDVNSPVRSVQPEVMPREPQGQKRLNNMGDTLNDLDAISTASKRLRADCAAAESTAVVESSLLDQNAGVTEDECSSTTVSNCVGVQQLVFSTRKSVVRSCRRISTTPAVCLNVVPESTIDLVRSVPPVMKSTPRTLAASTSSFSDSSGLSPTLGGKSTAHNGAAVTQAGTQISAKCETKDAVEVLDRKRSGRLVKPSSRAVAALGSCSSGKMWKLFARSLNGEEATTSTLLNNEASINDDTSSGSPKLATRRTESLLDNKVVEVEMPGFVERELSPLMPSESEAFTNSDLVSADDKTGIDKDVHSTAEHLGLQAPIDREEHRRTAADMALRAERAARGAQTCITGRLTRLQACEVHDVSPAELQEAMRCIGNIPKIQEKLRGHRNLPAVVAVIKGMTQSTACNTFKVSQWSLWKTMRKLRQEGLVPKFLGRRRTMEGTEDVPGNKSSVSSDRQTASSVEPASKSGVATTGASDGKHGVSVRKWGRVVSPAKRKQIESAIEARGRGMSFDDIHRIYNVTYNTLYYHIRQMRGIPIIKKRYRNKFSQWFRPNRSHGSTSANVQTSSDVADSGPCDAGSVPVTGPVQMTSGFSHSRGKRISSARRLMIEAAVAAKKRGVPFSEIKRKYNVSKFMLYYHARRSHGMAVKAGSSSVDTADCAAETRLGVTPDDSLEDFQLAPAFSPGRKMSQERRKSIEAAVAARKNGKTLPEIKKMYNVSPFVLYYHTKRMQNRPMNKVGTIRTRSSRSGAPEGDTPTDDSLSERVHQALEEVERGELSEADIAQKCGVSCYTLQYYLKRKRDGKPLFAQRRCAGNSVTGDEGGGKVGRNAGVVDSVEARMCRALVDIEAGVARAEAAARHGVSPLMTVVCEWRRSRGHPVLPGGLSLSSHERLIRSWLPRVARMSRIPPPSAYNRRCSLPWRVLWKIYHEDKAGNLTPVVLTDTSVAASLLSSDSMLLKKYVVSSDVNADGESSVVELPDGMRQAVGAVILGKMRVKAASSLHQVSFCDLRDLCRLVEAEYDSEGRVLVQCRSKTAAGAAPAATPLKSPTPAEQPPDVDRLLGHQSALMSPTLQRAVSDYKNGRDLTALCKGYKVKKELVLAAADHQPQDEHDVHKSSVEQYDTVCRVKSGGNRQTTLDHFMMPRKPTAASASTLPTTPLASTSGEQVGAVTPSTPSSVNKLSPCGSSKVTAAVRRPRLSITPSGSSSSMAPAPVRGRSRVLHQHHRTAAADRSATVNTIRLVRSPTGYQIKGVSRRGRGGHGESSPRTTAPSAVVSSLESVPDAALRTKGFALREAVERVLLLDEQPSLVAEQGPFSDLDTIQYNLDGGDVGPPRVCDELFVVYTALALLQDGWDINRTSFVWMFNKFLELTGRSPAADDGWLDLDVLSQRWPELDGEIRCDTGTASVQFQSAFDTALWTVCDEYETKSGRILLKDNISNVRRISRGVLNAAAVSSSSVTDTAGSPTGPTAVDTPQTTGDNFDVSAERPVTVFEVETILAARLHPFSNAMQYLIRWKGYTDSWNTWEPVLNLNCPAVLEDFKRRWGTLSEPEKINIIDKYSPLEPGMCKMVRAHVAAASPASIKTSSIATAAVNDDAADIETSAGDNSQERCAVPTLDDHDTPSVFPPASSRATPPYPPPSPHDATLLHSPPSPHDATPPHPPPPSDPTDELQAVEVSSDPPQAVAEAVEVSGDPSTSVPEADEVSSDPSESVIEAVEVPVVSDDHAVVSDDRAVVSDDRAVVSDDRAVVSDDRAVVSDDRAVVSDGDIAGGVVRETLFENRAAPLSSRSTVDQTICLDKKKNKSMRKIRRARNFVAKVEETCSVDAETTNANVSDLSSSADGVVASTLGSASIGRVSTADTASVGEYLPEDACVQKCGEYSRSAENTSTLKEIVSTHTVSVAATSSTKTDLSTKTPSSAKTDSCTKTLSSTKTGSSTKTLSSTKTDSSTKTVLSTTTASSTTKTLFTPTVASTASSTTAAPSTTRTSCMVTACSPAAHTSTATSPSTAASTSELEATIHMDSGRLIRSTKRRANVLMKQWLVPPKHLIKRSPAASDTRFTALSGEPGSTDKPPTSDVLLPSVTTEGSTAEDASTPSGLLSSVTASNAVVGGVKRSMVSESSAKNNITSAVAASRGSKTRQNGDSADTGRCPKTLHKLDSVPPKTIQVLSKSSTATPNKIRWENEEQYESGELNNATNVEGKTDTVVESSPLVEDDVASLMKLDDELRELDQMEAEERSRQKNESSCSPSNSEVVQPCREDVKQRQQLSKKRSSEREVADIVDPTKVKRLKVAISDKPASLHLDRSAETGSEKFIPVNGHTDLDGENTVKDPVASVVNGSGGNLAMVDESPRKPPCSRTFQKPCPKSKKRPERTQSALSQTTNSRREPQSVDDCSRSSVQISAEDSEAAKSSVSILKQPGSAMSPRTSSKKKQECRSAEDKTAITALNTTLLAQNAIGKRQKKIPARLLDSDEFALPLLETGGGSEESFPGRADGVSKQSKSDAPPVKSVAVSKSRTCLESQQPSVKSVEHAEDAPRPITFTVSRKPKPTVVVSPMQKSMTNVPVPSVASAVSRQLRLDTAPGQSSNCTAGVQSCADLDFAPDGGVTLLEEDANVVVFEEGPVVINEAGELVPACFQGNITDGQHDEAISHTRKLTKKRSVFPSTVIVGRAKPIAGHTPTAAVCDVVPPVQSARFNGESKPDDSSADAAAIQTSSGKKRGRPRKSVDEAISPQLNTVTPISTQQLSGPKKSVPVNTVQLPGPKKRGRPRKDASQAASTSSVEKKKRDTVEVEDADVEAAAVEEEAPVEVTVDLSSLLMDTAVEDDVGYFDMNGQYIERSPLKQPGLRWNHIEPQPQIEVYSPTGGDLVVPSPGDQ